MIRSALALLAALFATADPASGDVPARFTVEVTGAGPDVILIPGLASSADVWTATVAQLAPTHRVHAIQVSGFAGAPVAGAAEGAVLGPLAEALADYAASLDRPAVIGHSLGGLVALRVAATRPEAVERVMVVDALPFYPLVFDPAATPGTVEPQAAALRDQLLAQSAEQFELSQTASMRALVKSDEARPVVLAWSLQSDRSVLARALYEDLITDVRPELPSIAAPVTVIYAWDPAMGVPADAVDGLYAAAYQGADAELSRLDGGFHFIMLDQPEAFAAAVRRFLD